MSMSKSQKYLVITLLEAGNVHSQGRGRVSEILVWCNLELSERVCLWRQ